MLKDHKFEVLHGDELYRYSLTYTSIFDGKGITKCPYNNHTVYLQKMYQDVLVEVKNFTKTDIERLFFKPKDIKGETLLMQASSRNNLDNFIKFWNFTAKYLNEEERRKVLKQENEESHNALYYAMTNGNWSVFSFVKELYKEKFSNEELKEILENINKDASFLERVIQDKSDDENVEIAQFLRETFQNDKSKLRKILDNRNKAGETIFKHTFDLLQGINQEIFANLLKEILKNDN